MKFEINNYCPITGQYCFLHLDSMQCPEVEKFINGGEIDFSTCNYSNGNPLPKGMDVDETSMIEVSCDTKRCPYGGRCSIPAYRYIQWNDDCVYK